MSFLGELEDIPLILNWMSVSDKNYTLEEENILDEELVEESVSSQKVKRKIC